MLREEITRGDDLYRRVHRDSISSDGRIEYTAFMNKGSRSTPDTEISVDLARLTTPKKTLTNAPPRVRPKLGVGALPAGVPIGLGMTVAHCPSKDNQAHTTIENTGPTPKTMCYKLAAGTALVLSPSDCSG